MTTFLQLHVNNPHGSEPDEPQNQIGIIGGGGDQRVTRTLHRAPAKASNNPPSSNPNAAQSSSVSRSVSMPKDSRLAGWFRKKKRL